jgi:hypothetical protein
VASVQAGAREAPRPLRREAVSPPRRGRYRPVAGCAADRDPCMFLRQLGGWLREPGFLAT